ncbi:flagellar biosynthetic protein FliR [Polynucleobacter sp. MWH-Aus1W21]|jgi:flagellar biosynthetic protein FliR|uniref:flagellar biosynthetic protein FliR n=1 Tax=Polynucleobacter sp. MWH-Aus1W21 TaxID=1855880 RepID=UPI001BFD6D5B|nr:flagellar biosynthetic protein FliR [Polynucleobacter sp. MWH-Aus1W21]QWD65753.1 flagellar biosynthetic protein FliR [Polynucleobacter sp. MWH-Aus1W21]
MLTMTGLQIEQYMAIFMFASLRVFGLFLTTPMFAFRSLPMQFRLLIALSFAVYIMPLIGGEQIPNPGSITFFASVIEVAIGAFIGFVIRVGFMVIDIASEVLSFQAGFSFASAYFRDPTLDSGLVGQFLGLIVIALAFTLNIHLVLIDLVLESFKTIPVGQWPGVWSSKGVVDVVAASFRLGLILSMPILLVYMMFNLTQAFLGRTSPQMNLFSVGFAVSIPLAFLVIFMILPDLQIVLERSLENPLQLIRQGVGTPNAQ